MATPKPPTQCEAAEAVLAFVRGDASWRSLEKAGVFVELTDDGCEVDNPWGIVVRVRISCAAEGLLKLVGDSDGLRRWATIIMGASNVFDLGEFEENDAGAVLLDALWDATEGGTVGDRAIEVAKRSILDPRI